MGIELAYQITHYTIGAENYKYKKQNGFVGGGDDDVVSLNLNGGLVLYDYKLTSYKNIIEVTLNPGEKNLVLCEGLKKPCSVAISFDD